MASGQLGGLESCNVKVTELDETNLPALFEEKLASIDVRTHGVVLIGVDMKGRSSACVTWVRDIIDKFCQQAADDRPNLVVVLLLHFPPEAVLGGIGLYPCTFLDGWEFFFLDSLGAPTAFRADLLLQLIWKSDADAIELPELVHHEAGMRATVTDFTRKVRLPIGGHVPTPPDDSNEGVCMFSGQEVLVCEWPGSDADPAP